MKHVSLMLSYLVAALWMSAALANEHPGLTAEQRQRMEARCTANPERCEQIKQRLSDAKARCEANPEACEARKDELKARAKARREACAADPQACAEQREAIRERMMERRAP
jgi:hypothetical protein